MRKLAPARGEVQDITGHVHLKRCMVGSNEARLGELQQIREIQRRSGHLFGRKRSLSLMREVRLIYCESMGMTTTVTDENKVEIPTDLAANLGIKPGTKLDWQITDQPDTLIIKVLPDYLAIANSLQGAGRKYLKPGLDPIHNLIAERVEEDAGNR